MKSLVLLGYRIKNGNVSNIDGTRKIRVLAGGE